MNHDSHTLLSSLPPEWPSSLLDRIRRECLDAPVKTVVLDDDPTGTQTVYDVPVLTNWGTDALAEELRGAGPLFYILTNTRAMEVERACEVNREIGANLTAAAAGAGVRLRVVSRGDSTLRGHYPAEVTALAEAVGKPSAPRLLVPFFDAGGRFTIGNIHYVREGRTLVPAGETEFARDAAFGYRSSDLREWVEEKTGGAVKASSVHAVTLEDLRRGGPERVAAVLSAVPPGGVCIANAAAMRDMEVLAAGLLAAERAGREFILRSAASIVPALVGLEPRPLLSRETLRLPERGGGLIVAGSYVSKTTRQLEELTRRLAPTVVELDAACLIEEGRALREIKRCADRVNRCLAAGRDTLLYTSRELVAGADGEESLSIGGRIARGLNTVVSSLVTAPRFLVAKGGITSSDVATTCMGVRRAMVLGQIAPGVPVWRFGAESRFPDLTYVVFPGNVGADETVADVVQELTGRAGPRAARTARV
jgi:uncharacterized protein YgbK (DUF1537 family)